MESRVTSRRVGWVACLTATAWTGQSLGSLLLDEPTSKLDLSMIIPVGLTGIALWLLGGLGWFGTGRLRTAVRMLAVATIATTVPCQIAFGYDVSALDPFAIIGTAALIGGLALGGIAVFRAGLAPRWVGVALILAQPAAIVAGLALTPISPIADHGDYSGAIGHGLAWWLIGLTLLGVALPFPRRTASAQAAPATR